MRISNGAGEIVFEGDSEAECVRWHYVYGRPSDYLAETGENMVQLASALDLDDKAAS